MQNMDLDSVPFRLMREFKYGVPVLLFLQAEGKAYQNQIRKALGSEIQPIQHALTFMVEEGLVLKHDLPEGRLIRSLYSLSSKGQKVAHIIIKCYDELLHLPN